MRVSECRSEHLLEVENLVSGKRFVTHGRRLRHFRNSDYNVTEEALHHLDYQKRELLVIESFEDIRENKDVIEFTVKCRGFNDVENDWLTAYLLLEDGPDLYQKCLKHINKSGLKRQRQIATLLLQ